ncbi:hypothetical protein ACFWSF_22960 [Streptomyces sp. NPDC058611]|uniref:hypothetical protein n=1 Tax=unclassified Streptomyces TaxID=2593676 RepID=UPI003648F23C
MTQPRDPQPDVPGSYLTALAERLSSDGCVTDRAEWQGRPVLAGTRSDNSLRSTARPVAVDTGTGEVFLYRGRPMHGRIFVQHVLTKADLYFP